MMYFRHQRCHVSPEDVILGVPHWRFLDGIPTICCITPFPNSSEISPRVFPLTVVFVGDGGQFISLNTEVLKLLGLRSGDAVSIEWFRDFADTLHLYPQLEAMTAEIVVQRQHYTPVELIRFRRGLWPRCIRRDCVLESHSIEGQVRSFRSFSGTGNPTAVISSRTSVSIVSASGDVVVMTQISRELGQFEVAGAGTGWEVMEKKFWEPLLGAWAAEGLNHTLTVILFTRTLLYPPPPPPPPPPVTPATPLASLSLARPVPVIPTSFSVGLSELPVPSPGPSPTPSSSPGLLLMGGVGLSPCSSAASLVINSPLPRTPPPFVSPSAGSPLAEVASFIARGPLATPSPLGTSLLPSPSATPAGRSGALATSTAGRAAIVLPSGSAPPEAAWSSATDFFRGVEEVSLDGDGQAYMDHFHIALHRTPGRTFPGGWLGVLARLRLEWQAFPARVESHLGTVLPPGSRHVTSTAACGNFAEALLMGLDLCAQRRRDHGLGPCTGQALIMYTPGRAAFRVTSPELLHLVQGRLEGDLRRHNMHSPALFPSHYPPFIPPLGSPASSPSVAGLAGMRGAPLSFGPPSSTALLPPSSGSPLLALPAFPTSRAAGGPVGGMAARGGLGGGPGEALTYMQAHFGYTPQQLPSRGSMTTGRFGEPEGGPGGGEGRAGDETGGAGGDEERSQARLVAERWAAQGGLVAQPALVCFPSPPPPPPARQQQKQQQKHSTSTDLPSPPPAVPPTPMPRPPGEPLRRVPDAQCFDYPVLAPDAVGLHLVMARTPPTAHWGVPLFYSSVPLRPGPAASTSTAGAAASAGPTPCPSPAPTPQAAASEDPQPQGSSAASPEPSVAFLARQRSMQRRQQRQQEELAVALIQQQQQQQADVKGPAGAESPLSPRRPSEPTEAELFHRTREALARSGQVPVRRPPRMGPGADAISPYPQRTGPARRQRPVVDPQLAARYEKKAADLVRPGPTPTPTAASFRPTPSAPLTVCGLCRVRRQYFDPTRWSSLTCLSVATRPARRPPEGPLPSLGYLLSVGLPRTSPLAAADLIDFPYGPRPAATTPARPPAAAHRKGEAPLGSSPAQTQHRKAPAAAARHPLRTATSAPPVPSAGTRPSAPLPPSPPPGPPGLAVESSQPQDAHGPPRARVPFLERLLRAQQAAPLASPNASAASPAAPPTPRELPPPADPPTAPRATSRHPPPFPSPAAPPQPHRGLWANRAGLLRLGCAPVGTCLGGLLFGPEGDPLATRYLEGLLLGPPSVAPSAQPPPQQQQRLLPPGEGEVALRRRHLDLVRGRAPSPRLEQLLGLATPRWARAARQEGGGGGPQQAQEAATGRLLVGVRYAGLLFDPLLAIPPARPACCPKQLPRAHPHHPRGPQDAAPLPPPTPPPGREPGRELFCPFAATLQNGPPPSAAPGPPRAPPAGVPEGGHAIRWALVPLRGRGAGQGLASGRGGGALSEEAEAARQPAGGDDDQEADGWWGGLGLGLGDEAGDGEQELPSPTGSSSSSASAAMSAASSGDDSSGCGSFDGCSAPPSPGGSLVAAGPAATTGGPLVGSTGACSGDDEPRSGSRGTPEAAEPGLPPPQEAAGPLATPTRPAATGAATPQRWWAQGRPRPASLRTPLGSRRIRRPHVEPCASCRSLHMLLSDLLTASATGPPPQPQPSAFGGLSQPWDLADGAPQCAFYALCSTAPQAEPGAPTAPAILPPPRPLGGPALLRLADLTPARGSPLGRPSAAAAAQSPIAAWSASPQGASLLEAVARLDGLLGSLAAQVVRPASVAALPMPPPPLLAEARPPSAAPRIHIGPTQLDPAQPLAATPTPAPTPAPTPTPTPAPTPPLALPGGGAPARARAGDSDPIETRRAPWFAQVRTAVGCPPPADPAIAPPPSRSAPPAVHTAAPDGCRPVPLWPPHSSRRRPAPRAGLPCPPLAYLRADEHPAATMGGTERWGEVAGATAGASPRLAMGPSMDMDDEAPSLLWSSVHIRIGPPALAARPFPAPDPPQAGGVVAASPAGAVSPAPVPIPARHHHFAWVGPCLLAPTSLHPPLASDLALRPRRRCPGCGRLLEEAGRPRRPRQPAHGHGHGRTPSDNRGLTAPRAPVAAPLGLHPGLGVGLDLERSAPDAPFKDCGCGCSTCGEYRGWRALTRHHLRWGSSLWRSLGTDADPSQAQAQAQGPSPPAAEGPKGALLPGETSSRPQQQAAVAPWEAQDVCEAALEAQAQGTEWERLHTLTSSGGPPGEATGGDGAGGEPGSDALGRRSSPAPKARAVPNPGTGPLDKDKDPPPATGPASGRGGLFKGLFGSRSAGVPVAPPAPRTGPLAASTAAAASSDGRPPDLVLGPVRCLRYCCRARPEALMTVRYDNYHLCGALGAFHLELHWGPSAHEMAAPWRRRLRRCARRWGWALIPVPVSAGAVESVGAEEATGGFAAVPLAGRGAAFLLDRPAQARPFEQYLTGRLGFVWDNAAQQVATRLRHLWGHRPWPSAPATPSASPTPSPAVLLASLPASPGYRLGILPPSPLALVGALGVHGRAGVDRDRAAAPRAVWADPEAAEAEADMAQQQPDDLRRPEDGPQARWCVLPGEEGPPLPADRAAAPSMADEGRWCGARYLSPEGALFVERTDPCRFVCYPNSALGMDHDRLGRTWARTRGRLLRRLARLRRQPTAEPPPPSPSKGRQ
ncbi:hypothetical protein PAPYR_1848 [Paratrimastix pyriformis]|uniref:Vacuolar membrane-associated protein Iml1 N-terminal domain-containing protein n=1 Tax=Paratrimastix pyriformis TaxID=342808 RepID=A0ABQ8UUG5_9EUKA|nr:hypothetical protein PAPYR_1848 [Paratrimastix pyriformis]